MAQLGWIDFSSEDREKVRQVLAMAAEKGTLDELGVGQIRDAFSDLLFPGISTIQTRAKYFITVPRIIRDYLNLKHSSHLYKKGLQHYLSVEENKLVETFVNVHGDDEKGIVGSSTVSSGGVKRLPSEIYWNGLRTFGLIDTKVSLTEFSRHLSNAGQAIEWGHAEDNEQRDAVKLSVELPDDSEKWADEDNLTIELSRKEAEFLKEKMLANQNLSASIPVQLFKHELVGKALEEFNNDDLIAFDALSELMLKSDQVDEVCKDILRLARDFSLAMEGPHIRLNILLAKNNGYEDSAEKYETEFSVWLERVTKEEVFANDKENNWLAVTVNGQQRNIKTDTQTFIRQWCDAIRNGADVEELDKIVREQSRANKGKRGLFNRKMTQKGWVGIRRLDFRWGAAKNIIADINEGLHA